MLENVKVQIIKLSENESFTEVLLTVSNGDKKTNFVRKLPFLVDEKITLIDDLIAEGSYVSEGFEIFQKRFGKFLSEDELDSAYKNCTLIHNKLNYLFEDYINKWDRI